MINKSTSSISALGGISTPTTVQPTTGNMTQGNEQYDTVSITCGNCATFSCYTTC